MAYISNHSHSSHIHCQFQILKAIYFRMSEKPQINSMCPSIPETTLQARDIAPGTHRERPEGDAGPSTFSYTNQAGQTQLMDICGGHEATNGVRPLAFGTYVEMNMAGNQATTDRECYDAIQNSLASSALILTDILSEIRQLQLRLTVLEQALSTLRYPQQTPFWEDTSDYTEFLVPNFMNMQAQNYPYPTYTSQSDIFVSDDTKTDG